MFNEAHKKSRQQKTNSKLSINWSIYGHCTYWLFGTITKLP